jgi:hypothetical protein
MKHKEQWLWLLTAVLLLLSLYVGSYVALSVNGCYEPCAIGLNGVKSYAWAPYAFMDGYRWRRGPMLFFAPLSVMDERYWHPPGYPTSGCPVDRVERKDIWKVYQAWDPKH